MTPLAYYVDFSFSQPPPAVIKASGYDGVCIYLGSARPDPGYIQQLRDQGLAIVPVQEWGPTDAYGGYDVGVRMAQQANDACDEMGVPADCSIAYVVADTPYTSDEFARALTSFSFGVQWVGRRGFRLAYGNEHALDLAAPLWQWGVETWSDERNGLAGWEGKSNLALVQMANTRAHAIPGYDTDENLLLVENFGQWGASNTPTAQNPLPAEQYSQGVSMLKFTDQHGTAVEMFVAGTSLFVRYWKNGAMGVPVELSKDVEPGSDLLPISAFSLVLVHVPCHSQPGKVVEAYPSPYGYLARVI